MDDKPKPRWRSIVFTAVKVLFVGAAAFFVGKVFVDNWPRIRAGWHSPAPLYLGLAAAALLFSYFYLCRISLAVLAQLGYRLNLRAGLRPFFYTLLGRYIPGRIAVVIGKVYMYEKRGVPRVRAILAPAYENVFAATGGFTAALACVAALFSNHFQLWQLAPAAAAILGLALIIQPPVLRRLLGFVLRRFGKLELENDMVIPTGRAAAFAALYFGYCLTPGIFFAFFARAFVDLSGLQMISVGAAYVAASVLGYAVIFAPSGIGVREGFLLVILLLFMDKGQAAFLAVASRVVAVAFELGLAGFAALAGNERKAIPRPGGSG